MRRLVEAKVTINDHRNHKSDHWINSWQGTKNNRQRPTFLVITFWNIQQTGWECLNAIHAGRLSKLRSQTLCVLRDRRMTKSAISLKSCDTHHIKLVLLTITVQSYGKFVKNNCITIYDKESSNKFNTSQSSSVISATSLTPRKFARRVYESLLFSFILEKANRTTLL